MDKQSTRTLCSVNGQIVTSNEAQRVLCFFGVLCFCDLFCKQSTRVFLQFCSPHGALCSVSSVLYFCHALFICASFGVKGFEEFMRVFHHQMYGERDVSSFSHEQIEGEDPVLEVERIKGKRGTT